MRGPFYGRIIRKSRREGFTRPLSGCDARPVRRSGKSGDSFGYISGALKTWATTDILLLKLTALGALHVSAVTKAVFNVVIWSPELADTSKSGIR